MTWLRLAITGAAMVGAMGACFSAGEVVGPRGPVGPDVPLSTAEKRQFAKRVAVEGRSAAAVQAACERARREGISVVLLPAREYAFESTVRVPGGLTVLGEGPGTVIRAGDTSVRLFEAGGDDVRFTRLKLEGADRSTNQKNESIGIAAAGKQRVRVDHCELAGFCNATRFSDEASAQVDHCAIHHNLVDGLGYGVVVYSGAQVLVTDSEFGQNRHSLASNGALDWSSGERLGKFVHVPGVRQTHWELVHNRFGSNDLSSTEEFAVDTHPGMDGTFVVEDCIFDGLRRGIVIRDGSGIIRGNVFRNLRAATGSRSRVAVLIGVSDHNGKPVEGAMPHDITVTDNTFEGEFDTWIAPGSDGRARPARYEIGKAENVTIDGTLVPATATERGPAPPLPRLRETK
jgi:hypothetical protein